MESSWVDLPALPSRSTPGLYRIHLQRLSHQVCILKSSCFRPPSPCSAHRPSIVPAGRLLSLLPQGLFDGSQVIWTNSVATYSFVLSLASFSRINVSIRGALARMRSHCSL